MLILPEFPEIDGNRLVRMCLIHDFGEAIYGGYSVVSEDEGTRTPEESAVESCFPRCRSRSAAS
jgi:putative hydrolase of HD superfamily